MLNGCAIDNVLPAMAMHADLLKGDIIVKVDDTPATAETVHKQLIGEDMPGTSVMLTVRRGHTERTAQLIRMANSDIADMRRVFEIFTNLKSRFPVISGEVDEVVTIWSEVVSGDALYRAQISNSLQRLQREGSIQLEDLKSGLQGLDRNVDEIAEALEDARMLEDRLADVKHQLLHFGRQFHDQLSSQGAALRDITRERDVLKDTVVDARVQNQANKGLLDSLRYEGDSVKDRLLVVTQERDKSRLELERVQGQHWELRDLVAADAERLRSLESELEQAKSDAERAKGQLLELREYHSASNEQVSAIQHDKRQLKTELDSTKGLMDELRKQISDQRETMERLQSEKEKAQEDLDRARGALEVLREEHEHAKASQVRLAEHKEQVISECERTQGQLVEIRKMLGDRGRQLEETEMQKQRLSADFEALKGKVPFDDLIHHASHAWLFSF